MDKKALQKEYLKTKKLLENLELRMVDAPVGQVRCEMQNKKYPQFYLKGPKTPGQPSSYRFVKKQEMEQIRQIVQSEYENKLWKHLKKKEKALFSFLKNYPDVSERDIFAHMPPAKQQLITPIIPTDEMYLEKWMKEHPGNQNTYPITNGFLTERGEMVRSKSEKMIADKLFYMNIPYQYETLIRLPNKAVICPDFTMLNVNSRKTFYLEHLGMMDDPDYCKHAIEKIETYEANQIFLNDTLLVTMESSKKGINMAHLERMLKRHLL